MTSTTRFEAQLEADGYEQVVRKSMPADTMLDEHTHPFDARLMVLEGGITITVDGVAIRYGEGDTCSVAAGHPHAESVGREGCRMIVGRRAVEDAA